MNFKTQILILSFAFAILNQSIDRMLYKRKLDVEGKTDNVGPGAEKGAEEGHLIQRSIFKHHLWATIVIGPGGWLAVIALKVQKAV